MVPEIQSETQIFLSFWAIFCRFTSPPNDPEYKNFEKMKKMPGDVNPFIHMFTINEDHMIYGS